MCASQIWAKHFAEDPLSRAAGERLWKHLLAYGVSRPPRATLRDLLGGALDPRHYYRALVARDSGTY
jgi:Zn-dependent oligopeptidase